MRARAVSAALSQAWQRWSQGAPPLQAAPALRVGRRCRALQPPVRVLRMCCPPRASLRVFPLLRRLQRWPSQQPPPPPAPPAAWRPAARPTAPPCRCPPQARVRCRAGRAPPAHSTVNAPQVAPRALRKRVEPRLAALAARLLRRARHRVSAVRTPASGARGRGDAPTRGRGRGAAARAGARGAARAAPARTRRG